MNKGKYTADLVNKGFWFTEFRKTIELMNEGKTNAEIKMLQKTENVYLAPSEDTGRRMASTITKRIDQLPEEIVNQYFSYDMGTQRIVNLLATIKVNQLFFEFMYEIYREDRIIGKKELDDSSLRVFFKNKAAQHEKVATFTDATIKRLSGAYKTYLREAGLLEETTNIYIPPVIDAQLEDILKTPEWEPYYKAIMGVV